MMRQPSRLIVLFGIVTLVFGGALAAMAQGDSYTVQRGDTLDGIAAFYDVQTQCLATSNNLESPGKLEIGQVIAIDLSCPPYDGLDFVANPRDAGDEGGDLDQGGGGGEGDTTVQAGPNDETYVVEVSDTLDTIAQEFDVSIISLRLVNGIEPGDPIFPGDQLVIPGDAPAYGQYPAITNAGGAAADQELGQGGGGVVAGPGDQTYVVQPLDSLDKIGAMFDAQVACIAAANNITDPSTIFPGQTVIVQSSCPAYDGYDTVTTPRDGEAEATEESSG